ncbi:GGDEF domain-containing protein [Hyphomicrobium sp.]|uniref:GGDEF domain-containing protein n=1 Tax=Hyphomicrobium sp. TaxID=82 RepID=UPI0025BED077|nr:GGDEF domain-containing protein [Hyphomicrobium sp.]MCC7253710.1 GGDEF domain-containing protein [Hyphomicrobium sp.]
MSRAESLASAVRRHPWSSAQDAMVLGLAMLVSLLLALEYDIVAFWDQLDDRQRRLRVEEIALLTVLLAIGLGIFAVRRMKEARLDVEREMRARLEAQSAHALAMQDPLTELPNRRALASALETAIGRPPPDGRMHAFYLLDLNGFKRVNDEHGHAAGDELLRIVAKRFRAVARKGDMVARIGGDEFAVLACNVDSRNSANQIGERFVSALGEQVSVSGRSHAIGVAVGVALYPENGSTADEIMHHADLAMYKAKARRSSSVIFFEAA